MKHPPRPHFFEKKDGVFILGWMTGPFNRGFLRGATYSAASEAVKNLEFCVYLRFGPVIVIQIMLDKVSIDTLS